MAELEVERVEIERALRELEERQREAASVLESPMEAHDVPRTTAGAFSPAQSLGARQGAANVPPLDLSAEERRSEQHFFPGGKEQFDASLGWTESGSNTAAANPTIQSAGYSGASSVLLSSESSSPQSMHELPGSAVEHSVEEDSFISGVGDVASNVRATSAPASPAKPPPSGRRVLFVYPRNMDVEAVARCASCARQTVLSETDVVTLVWAGRATPESTGDSLVLPAAADFPGEDTISTVREVSPAAAKLLQSHALSTRTAGTASLKAYPNSEIRWVLQQEFQNPDCASLVLLPCSPDDADCAMEKFVIEHSPVPVALVRCPPAVSD